MTSNNYQEIFTDNTLQELFPASRANDFFDALYGDVEEGVYDISLSFAGHDQGNNTLHFNLNLTERPDKCLACHLTYGLPEVFSRHPIINIAGMVNRINELLGEKAACGEWHLEPTQTVSRKLYAVPLTISLN